MTTQHLVGIITALAAEARCLSTARAGSKGPDPSDDAVRIHAAGMGAAHARAAAQMLVEEGATALVSWGVAGALAPTLQTGAIVLASQVIDAENNTYVTTVDWLNQLHHVLAAGSRLSVHTGVILTTASPAHMPADKQHLRHTYRAVAVDMESAAIAGVANEVGLPFVAVRSIADTAAVAIPSTATAMVNLDGQLQLLRGLGHWGRHPQQTPALLHLACSTQRACRSLRTVAQRCGPQLLAQQTSATGQPTQVSPT